MLLVSTKGLAFLRDPLVAALYGASASSDSFYVALGVINLLSAVMLGGLVASVVPLFLSRRLQAGDRSAWSFLSAFVFWLGACFAVIGGLTFVFADGVVGLFAPGLNIESHRLAVQMLRILTPVPMLTAVTTSLSSALNCYNRFLVPASMPLLGSAISIALLIALTPSLGVGGAAMAVAAGAGIQCVTIAWLALRQARGFRAEFRLADRALGAAVRLAVPGVLAEGLLFCLSFMILYLATSLGAGVFSTIQYGNKLQAVFLDVFIAAINVVMYPQLASAAAHNNIAELRRLNALNLRLMALILLPIAAAIIILRVPLTELVYQRRAFDAEATARTASALGLLAISLVPLAVKDACVRGFYSLRDSTTPLRMMGVAVILDIGMSLLLVRLLGGNGLVLAYSLSVAFLAGMLLLQLRKRGILVVDRQILSPLAKVGTATAAMACALLLARWLMGASGTHSQGKGLLELMIYALVCAVVYVLSLSWLGEEETRAYLTSIISGWRGIRERTGW